jgi:hypothetical protein
VTKRYARAKEINDLYVQLSNMGWQPAAQNGKAAGREIGGRTDSGPSVLAVRVRGMRAILRQLGQTGQLGECPPREGQSRNSQSRLCLCD